MSNIVLYVIKCTIRKWKILLLTLEAFLSTKKKNVR